jgi:hypothetical protein
MMVDSMDGMKASGKVDRLAASSVALLASKRALRWAAWMV